MTPSSAPAQPPLTQEPPWSGRTGRFGGRRGRRRIVGALLVLFALAAGVVVTFPSLVGLGGVPGLLHAVSFRGWSALTAGAVALVGAVVAVLRRRRPDRRVWWVITGVVLAVAVANVSVLVVRSVPAAAAAPGRVPDAGRTVTVLEYNTEGGATTPAEIARLAADAGADVIALPETTGGQAERIAADPAVAGRGYQVFSHRELRTSGSATSLLVAASMGQYRVLDTPSTGLGAVRAVPVDGAGPTIAAVHAVPPTGDFGYDQWQRTVTTALSLAAPTGSPQDGSAIVAGDFNATLDHQPLHDLGGAVDAARAAGLGAQGTWPSDLPPLLGAPIDHVLFDPAAYRVGDARTVQSGASDHRGLVVTLVQAAAAAPPAQS